MKRTYLNFIQQFRILAISILVLLFFVIFTQTSLAVAGINRTINFQGKLVNNPTATNVTDTSYTVVFTIYDRASGGTALWSETQTVTTADGIFRVALGSQTAFPANFNFNWDGLYLGMKVNADDEMTPRIQLAAVPYAFNAGQVAGLTVQDSTSGAASTSATLKLGDATTPKTFDLGAQNLTFTTSGDTTLTLPTTGTLLTSSAAAVQTVTSTQTTGTVLGLADSTGLTGAITGLNIALTSSTNSQNKTGIAFDLSGGSSGTYYDLLGTGSTWSITRAGVLNVASCTGCGGAGGTNYWNLIDGNGVSNGGYITPINSTADFLLGSQATASAVFAFTGLSDLNHQTAASFSGNLVLKPNNGFGGNASIAGTLTVGQGQTIRPEYGPLQLAYKSGGNAWTTGLSIEDTTGNIFINPNGTGNVAIGTANPASSNPRLQIEQTKTNTSGFVLAMTYNILTAGPGSASSAEYVAQRNAVQTANNAIAYSGSIIGLYNQASHRGTNTLDVAIGSQGIVSQDNTGTITDAYAYRALSQQTAAANTIVTYTGYYASTPTISGGGTLGTTYGLQIEALSIGSTANYGARIDAATTQTLWLSGNADNTTAAAGIAFGASRDTNLYRSDTNTLKTDDAFIAASFTSSGAIAANGGITFDQTSDTIGSHTLGGGILGNSQSITALSGVTINGGGTIDSASSGTLGIATTTNTTGLTIGNSGATSGMTFNIDTAANYTFQKEGSAYACSGTNKLTLNAGVLECATDQTGGGGGIESAFVIDSATGVTRQINNTADFLIGGTSTASAKFVFGGLNNGAVPTATFSGNVIINSRPNTSLPNQQKFTRISAGAGQIASGGTTGIASVSASTVYNGSLYVGTSNPTNPNGSAEVYRYNGSVLNTWTKVSNTTAGTITAAGTSGIASVSAMTTFDGFLYIGTSKQNAAEIYRYDGTTWTKISQAAGTIRSGGTTLIDGVTTLAVYNGRLYAGTKEGLKAELYRYEGGTTWSIVNTTAGTFVTTNSVGVDAVTSMVTTGGYLYLGTTKANNAADVLRYNGGVGASVFTKMNNNTSGTFTLVSGTTITAVSEVASMVSYNGSIVIGIRRAGGQADILSLSTGTSTGDYWLRLNSAAGTITASGTSGIDTVSALTVYNGRLYAGTYEPGNAEVYRYEGIGSWTKVSGAVAGRINGSAGGTTGISGISILQSNNVLYVMSYKYTNEAEIYAYESYLDQSYNLTFRATPGLVGGVQNNVLEEGSIFFLASSSAIANNKSSQNGAFVFSHTITTRNGAYDVAEDYPTRDDTLEPGDLISIDTNERGYVRKTEGLNDSALIGIYSENPALRLSQNDGTLGNAKVLPVALAGRVPVKVSTENGKIKSGDFLTASSVPGVAMKATKSGVVVGQAMAPYDEDGVGKITVYVKSNSYSGTTAELFQGIDVDKVDFEQDILAKLRNQETDGIISEINTDRLIAGLEIISPKIVTDELIAKTIKAERIEGLELIISNKLTNLASQGTPERQVLSDQDIAASISAQLDLRIASNSAYTNKANINLDSDGLAVFERIRIKQNALVEGILNVVDTLTANNFIVNNLATFFGDVVFKGNVVFEGRPTFNKDTGGIAIIKKNSDRVDIVFEKEYEEAPIISASITFNEEKKLDGSLRDTKELEQKLFAKSYSFVVVNKSKKGFIIVLNKKAEDDIEFSWLAVSVRENKISISKTLLDLILSPTLTPQPSNSGSSIQGGGEN